ncbi:hypothetical protein D3C87_1069980 [compost metagenome]
MSIEFFERVAERAGTNVGRVKEVLERRGIHPDRVLNPPRRLCLSRLAFQGEKAGKAVGLIDFDWNALKPGIYGIASVENFVGKSSILEIVLWALRGRPKNLQDDVRTWLHRVTLEFLIDDVPYRLEVTLDQGRPNGHLIRLEGQHLEKIDWFSSDEEFEACMGRFMMDVFDVEPIPARFGKLDDARTIYHSWPALSMVMYIGGEHEALLGEVAQAGLPGRTLQMFIGLPWARSLMHATTQQKSIADDTAIVARARPPKAVEDRREELLRELEAIERDLERLKSSDKPFADIQVLKANSWKGHRDRMEAETQRSKAVGELAELEQQALDDERACLELREASLAERFFNGLEPKCCPRCDSAVKVERVRKEGTSMECYLCTEPIAFDDPEAYDDLMARAEAQFEASRKAVKRAKAHVAELEAALRKIVEETSAVDRELSLAIENDPRDAIRRLEVEIATLKGTLAGLDMQFTPAPSPAPPSKEGPIVDAAKDEAKARFDARKEAILQHLNEEILRLAVKFGIRGLESVKLTSDSKMNLVKGGSSTWFSKLTTGERLRLRIATTVALLRLGRESGLGRHPGLLLIDSPGAEETNELDLANLMRELHLISEEVPDLQVFVASANIPSIAGELPPERCRVAYAGETIW